MDGITPWKFFATAKAQALSSTASLKALATRSIRQTVPSFHKNSKLIPQITWHDSFDNRPSCFTQTSSKKSCSGALSNWTSRYARSWNKAQLRASRCGFRRRIFSLTGSINFFLDLGHAQSVVVSQILAQTSHIEFAQAMKSQPVESVVEVAEDLHAKGYHLDLEAAFRQRKGGDIAGAIIAIRKVAAGTQLSGHFEIQFNAVLQAGELEWMQVYKSDVPQARAAETKLATALELCRIAKRKPRNLHLFAQITRKAAELAVAVQKTAGLFMIWKGHKERGDDPLWLAVLSFQLQESLIAAYKKYRQALRLAQATAKSKYRSITSRPLVDVAISIVMLAGLLETSGFGDIVASYRESAFEIIRFASGTNGLISFRPVTTIDLPSDSPELSRARTY